MLQAAGDDGIDWGGDDDGGDLGDDRIWSRAFRA